jgi:valyl-tRNA synthetase
MPHEDWEDAAVKDFELIQEIVRTIRNLRSEFKIEPSKTVDAILVSESRADFLRQNQHLLIDLAGLNEKELKIFASKPETEGWTVVVIEDIEIYLDLNTGSKAQLDRERIEKELVEAESQIERLEKLLASPFAQKAPEKVVQVEREKLEGYRLSAIKLRERLR